MKELRGVRRLEEGSARGTKLALFSAVSSSSTDDGKGRSRRRRPRPEVVEAWPAMALSPTADAGATAWWVPSRRARQLMAGAGVSWNCGKERGMGGRERERERVGVGVGGIATKRHWR